MGSCAQIGKNVHLGGGVEIGGVLQPIGASPVIIEDGALIGSGCMLAKGIRVGKQAVPGAHVVLDSSSEIIDVTGSETVGNERLCSGKSSSNSRKLYKEISGRRISSSLCFDNWQKKKAFRFKKLSCRYFKRI